MYSLLTNLYTHHKINPFEYTFGTLVVHFLRKKLFTLHSDSETDTSRPLPLAGIAR